MVGAILLGIVDNGMRDIAGAKFNGCGIAVAATARNLHGLVQAFRRFLGQPGRWRGLG